MSSNLFKFYYLNKDTENARVIDSNEMIAQKLERIRVETPQINHSEGYGGFEAVDFAKESENLDAADLLSSDFTTADGAADTSSVIKTSGFAEALEEPVYNGPSPEELIAQAQEEIEQMRSNALQELEEERMNVLNSAQAEGYEAGRKQAMQEMESARLQLEGERRQLEAAYEKQIDELEPLFVKTLTDIYEKVFEVGLDNQQKIVVTLLRNTMKKLEGCKNFLVHVSTSDYPYVKEHKAELLSDSTPEGTVIDIIEDSMIRENECTIETMNGIYDCGIGTQLEGLRRKLTLLSYEGHQES